MTPAHLLTPITPDLVRGALELEPTDRGLRPHRLPAWARAQGDDPQLAMAEAQPSGVRLVLRTAATVLELDTVPTKRSYPGAPPRPDGTYDLLVDGRLLAQGSVAGGDVVVVDLRTGPGETVRGEPGTVRFEGLPGTEARVEVWLPHDEATELVALRTDAPVHPVLTTPGTSGDAPRTWLHHGSSISHGSSATHPTGTWPAVAAAAAGVDLVNLGFGGSALLDPFVSRVLRDTPADLVSVKIGINLVNLDLMRRRAFVPAVHGLLDTVREGHPDTPLLLVSPIWCPTHEHTPGPAAPDPAALAEGRVVFTATGDPGDPSRMTLTSIRDDLARVAAQRAATDPHLTYLDGRELYGEADHDAVPLPDGLHPDGATHRLIGTRFAALALT